MTYDPVDYWSRLHRRADLSAVGQESLDPAANTWLYRALTRNLRGFIRRNGVLSADPMNAFDVGAGTGHWIRFWREVGIPRVDGCDLVPDAVARLTERLGDDRSRFLVADISDAEAPEIGEYDLVSCMNVLLHVTDEHRFDIALRNIARLVRPRGALLLAEPILLHASYELEYQPERESRARPLHRYRVGLEEAGLQLQAIGPGTVLANNPMEASSPLAYRLFWAWWIRAAVRLGSDLRGTAVGLTMYALDAFAMHTGAAPTTKFALFRRAER